MLMHMALFCRRRGLLSFCVGIFLTVLSASFAFPLDYTIKEVIEVGEADFVPFLGPLKWSPDGTKLAFFKNGVLKTSDTLGKVSEVVKLDVAPHRYDWVSNEKIALELRSFSGPGMNTHEKLITVDVPSGLKATIHEFTTSPGYRRLPGKTTSSGPYKTVEGNKFYLLTTYNAEGGKTIVERRSFLDHKTDRIENDHIARWGVDGLYLVQLDQRDSLWIAPKPFARMGFFPEVKSDHSFAIDGGQLFNLMDSTRIVLDTMLGSPPPNTFGCGVAWPSFNPSFPEIVFTITCDDGENYIVNSLALFDCELNKVTKIDSLIHIYNCSAAEYSPIGKNIAFIANGKACILKREVQ